MAIRQFDQASLAGNAIFQEHVRTLVRLVGTRALMELHQVIPSESISPGDQAIALEAKNALGAILNRLGIGVSGAAGNVELSIQEMILTFLASSTVRALDPPFTYQGIADAVEDGTIVDLLEPILYEFIKGMTGLSSMSLPAQAMMLSVGGE